MQIYKWNRSRIVRRHLHQCSGYVSFKNISNLIYFCAAPPSFEIKTRTQTALKGENTVLSCEAKGEKPIGILWNMNNKRLESSMIDPRYISKSIIPID